MSAKKKTTRSTSTLNIVLVVQLIIMLGLSIFITVEISKQTRKNANDHMRAITDERAHIIESFVENAEKTLTYFSKSKEVIEMFKDPTNADKRLRGLPKASALISTTAKVFGAVLLILSL